MAKKWARVSNPMPSKTIGVPNNEQINSPVTFGDHKMVAVMKRKKRKRKFKYKFIFSLL